MTSARPQPRSQQYLLSRLHTLDFVMIELILLFWGGLFGLWMAYHEDDYMFCLYSYLGLALVSFACYVWFGGLGALEPTPIVRSQRFDVDEAGWRQLRKNEYSGLR